MPKDRSQRFSDRGKHRNRSQDTHRRNAGSRERDFGHADEQEQPRNLRPTPYHSSTDQDQDESDETRIILQVAYRKAMKIVFGWYSSRPTKRESKLCFRLLRKSYENAHKHYLENQLEFEQCVEKIRSDYKIYRLTPQHNERKDFVEFIEHVRSVSLREYIKRVRNSRFFNKENDGKMTALNLNDFDDRPSPKHIYDGKTVEQILKSKSSSLQAILPDEINRIFEIPPLSDDEMMIEEQFDGISVCWAGIQDFKLQNEVFDLPWNPINCEFPYNVFISYLTSIQTKQFNDGKAIWTHGVPKNYHNICKLRYLEYIHGLPSTTDQKFLSSLITAYGIDATQFPAKVFELLHSRNLLKELQTKTNLDTQLIESAELIDSSPEGLTPPYATDDGILSFSSFRTPVVPVAKVPPQVKDPIVTVPGCSFWVRGSGSTVSDSVQSQSSQDTRVVEPEHRLPLQTRTDKSSERQRPLKTSKNATLMEVDLSSDSDSEARSTRDPAVTFKFTASSNSPVKENTQRLPTDFQPIPGLSSSWDATDANASHPGTSNPLILNKEFERKDTHKTTRNEPPNNMDLSEIIANVVADGKFGKQFKKARKFILNWYHSSYSYCHLEDAPTAVNGWFQSLLEHIRENENDLTNCVNQIIRDYELPAIEIPKQEFVAESNIILKPSLTREARMKLVDTSLQEALVDPSNGAKLLLNLVTEEINADYDYWNPVNLAFPYHAFVQYLNCKMKEILLDCNHNEEICRLRYTEYMHHVTKDNKKFMLAVFTAYDANIEAYPARIIQFLQKRNLLHQASIFAHTDLGPITRLYSAIEIEMEPDITINNESGTRNNSPITYSKPNVTSHYPQTPQHDGHDVKIDSVAPFYEIPFDAWKLICQRTRVKLERTAAYPNTPRPLTEEEYRLCYVRYLNHVEKNMDSFLDGVLTAYPDLVVPEEVRNLIKFRQLIENKPEYAVHENPNNHTPNTNTPLINGIFEEGSPCEVSEENENETIIFDYDHGEEITNTHSATDELAGLYERPARKRE